MAASSGENISTRDLSKLPDISFTFVEYFIKGHGTSSGKEQMAKGFKYYSEEYVHFVLVVIRIRKSKDRQWKRTNNDLQTLHIKLKIKQHKPH
jgi:hypothetical protein